MSENDATVQLTEWLGAFAHALAESDAAAVAALFQEECYWRDLIAFTWTIRTMEGQPAIRTMVEARAADVRASAWTLDGDAKQAAGIVEGWLTFETAVARGRGYVRLKGGKARTLLTAMMELKGFEEKQGHTREMGVLPRDATDRRPWLERRNDIAATLGHEMQPYCLVIGGGQGGLALGARLKQLGVPTLIVDKHARPGDNWRSRYKSLCLHDPVWYDHMPYIPFPPHWPVFTPKDKLGDWLEMYAKVMELDCWNNTTCQSAQYDPATQRWTVVVDREGETITLHPAQLILATGNAGFPNLPTIPGMDDFQGIQHHSSGHGGGEAYAGKRCVVIGSNNSAHDICADLAEHGADVTMLQRSSTLVVRSETMMRLSYSTLYSEQAVANGMTTDRADLMAASMPYRLMPSVQTPIWERIKREDAPFYERLAAAGFLLDFGEDESGLSLKYLRRGSGYYIDVGASEMICNGTIKLRSDSNVAAIKPHAVLLEDGSELPADLIVYATGYSSMTDWAEMLISKEVADAVGPCWGFGSDTTRDPGPWQGELRNMWKPTAQPALWFHGGNLAQSRHYSRYLALQLKARMEGIPTPVY
jgi:putative flavoprotein involved in K+ transport